MPPTDDEDTRLFTFTDDQQDLRLPPPCRLSPPDPNPKSTPNARKPKAARKGRPPHTAATPHCKLTLTSLQKQTANCQPPFNILYNNIFSTKKTVLKRETPIYKDQVSHQEQKRKKLLRKRQALKQEIKTINKTLLSKRKRQNEKMVSKKQRMCNKK